MITAKQLANRLPHDLLPKTKSCAALLTAVVQLKNERNNAQHRVDELERAIELTIAENRHLADGDECTLKMLKDVTPNFEGERYARWND